MAKACLKETDVGTTDPAAGAFGQSRCSTLQTLVPRSVTFCVRRTGGWGRMIATDTPGTHIGSKQLFRCSWTDWVGQTVIRFVD